MEESRRCYIPKRFIVYKNRNGYILDPYTVVYPDGAVFLFQSQEPHDCKFLCSFNHFSKDDDDELIHSIKDSLLEAILRKEL